MPTPPTPPAPHQPGQGRPQKSGAEDATTPLLLHLDRVQAGLDHVAQLTEQNERLVVLGTMAASIAHEINNILTPVKAYAELALANPGETGLVVKALERAAQGVDRATRIAEMILACAKPRDGSSPPLIEEKSSTGNSDQASPISADISSAVSTHRADVADVVRRAVGALPPDLGEMYDVRLQVEGGLAAAIDGVALEQVLVNLLLNARSAMMDGGTTTIRARRAGARKESVSTNIMIEVEDIGCGIAADKLKSIFESFVTYSGNEGVAAQQRTGLGLAICRRLVSDAGGRIEAESEVGKGTRVRVVLPSAGERRGRSAA